MRTIAADIVLIRKEEVLLVRRGVEPFKGMWAVPGGRIEDDETLEECCLREMKEETGLDVKIEKLIGVYSNPKRDPRKVIAVVYLCGIVGGEMKAQEGEILEVKWFKLSELPELAADHREILRDAIGLL
ncbi:NUDIX hydrolase [Candidatus Micrarchaeota archaeon]|nr:NUDIX hydrolase [Candidatus Micrarchaeota archaeon]